MLAEKLANGLEQANINLSSEAQTKLLAYIDLIQKWNKVHNITAVRDPLEMVTLHLLDSLVVLPYLQAPYFEPVRMLDVGSGAGLPGIPLALARPDLQITVMDSSQKKASFMRQAKATLGLHNLTVECGRVEAYRPPQLFDAIISRAFSDLSLFVSLTHHLCLPHTKWLAMKGVVPTGELADLKEKTGLAPEAIYPLHVPMLDAQRHLLFLPYNTALFT